MEEGSPNSHSKVQTHEVLEDWQVKEVKQVIHSNRQHFLKERNAENSIFFDDVAKDAEVPDDLYTEEKEDERLSEYSDGYLFGS